MYVFGYSGKALVRQICGPCTLILDVQNFGSVFLRSNFWYQCNLRCYWQSQMLHCKIRITLASEVFHKKILCFAKASEVFEGIVIFLLNVPHVFWYFQTQKEKVIDTVCLTSPCYNQLCRIISSIKMDCVCNICSKRFPNQEKLGLHQYRIHSDKPFQCKLCGEKGNGANQYSNHMRKHKEPKSIQCEICQYESTDASNMNKHRCNQVFGSATSIPAKRNQNPSLIATYWKNIKRSTLMFFVQCAKDFLVQCGIWRSISRVLTSLPPMLRLLKTRMNRTMTRTLTQVQLTSRLRSF